jgi:hypothetical protein
MTSSPTLGADSKLEIEAGSFGDHFVTLSGGSGVAFSQCPHSKLKIGSCCHFMKLEGKSQQKVRTKVKLTAHRAGLPGNVATITVSAFLPAYKAGHPADLPAKSEVLCFPSI